MVSVDKNKIGMNNLIMDDYTKFLEPAPKSDKEKLKEFVYCMKMMSKT